MKVLLTGGRGMLGRTIKALWRDDEVIPTDLPEADITDPAGCGAVLDRYRPEVVVHCAAMTQVDRCESERELAFRLNGFGSACVAAACRSRGIRLAAISTDYVFDGASERSWSEFDQASGGRTVYGQSKFAGEEAVRRHCPDHLIVRVSWLYGFGGPSFVHTMLRLADGSRPRLRVVNDQHGNPTSALAVARKLRELLAVPGLVGTWHLTCEGEATWYEFALEIFRLAGVKQDVSPCLTAEYPAPAPRPANSRLDKMMLRLAGFSPMPDWHEALAEFIRLEFRH